MPAVLIFLGVAAILWNAINGAFSDDLSRVGYLIGEIGGFVCFGIGLIWYKLRDIEAAIRGEPKAKEPPKRLPAGGHVPEEERGIASACDHCKWLDLKTSGQRWCERLSRHIPKPDQPNPCKGVHWQRRD